MRVAAVAAIAVASASLAVPLARSDQGRAIDVTQVGPSDAPHRVLVVGCIHGNEPAGIAIANRLAALRPRSGVAVWIVRDANPDGVAAGTRGNADGVDLNRNFPWRWQPLVGIYNSGPHPLSEPETIALARLVRAVRPTLSIWFHQHLNVVDQSGGNRAVEHRYAQLVGLRLQRLTRYPGSAVAWENDLLRTGTAFVVELHAGLLSNSEANRYAHSILDVAR